MISTKRLFSILLAACLACALCSGCADTIPAAPTPALLASPPVASPAQKEAEALDALRAIDILEYLPEDTYARSEDQRWYEPVIENEELTLSLPDKYSAWLNAAIDDAHSDIPLEAGNLRVPEWPMLAAILTNYNGDPDGMRQALFAAGGIECSIEKTENDAVVAIISARPLDATELFSSLPASDVTNPVSLLLSYAYLSTVFDNSIHGEDGIGAPDLDALVFPV